MFKCNSCNVRHVQLVRIFGGWPPEEFKELQEEEQQKFWASESTDTKGLKQLAVDFLVKKRVESYTTEEKGSYLPLSVYEKMGYDVGRIEAKCEDFKEDPLLGRVFRVKLMSTTDSTMEQQIREQVLKKSCNKPSKPRGSKDLKRKHRQKDSGSSSDRSTSSTSSSDKKKQKKHKKPAKQHKKTKQSGEKDDKNTEKSKVKASRLARNLAGKAIAKLSPLAYRLSQDLDDKAISNVPAWASAAAKESLQHIEAMTKEAFNLMRDHVLRLSWTLDDVAELAKVAGSRAAVLTSLLDVAKQHAA